MAIDKGPILALLIALTVHAVPVHAQEDEQSLLSPPEVRNFLQSSATFLAHAYDLVEGTDPAWAGIQAVLHAPFREELDRWFKESAAAGAGEQFLDPGHGLFQIARRYEESPSLAAFGPASYSYVMANRGFPTAAENTPSALATAMRRWTVANTAIVKRNLQTVMKGLSASIGEEPARAAERIADVLSVRQAALRRATRQTTAFVEKYVRLKTAFETTLYAWRETSPAALGTAIHPLLIRALADSKPRPPRSAAEKERTRRIDQAIAFIHKNGIRFEETSYTGGNRPGPGLVTSRSSGSMASADTGYLQQLWRTAHLYLMCWSGGFAKRLGVRKADLRGALRPLHRFNLALAAEIVAFRDEFLDQIRNESGQPLLEIDEISWMEDDEEAEADFCRSLYPKEGETVEDRALYKDWIKKLICDYIKADFSDKADRTHYVKQVLAALRRNNSGTGWKISARQSVSHIVTQDPVALIRVTKDATPRLDPIESAGIQRSRFEPGTAAIGFHQDLFITPKATTVTAAEARIPDAERLIQYVFSLKVVADLIAENPETISQSRVNQKLEAQQKAFRSELLKKANAETLRGPAIAAMPDTDSKPAPNIDAAHNVKPFEPSDGTLKITNVKEGDVLGLTEAQHGISSRIGSTSARPQLAKLESVMEKATVLERRQHIVGVAVRTLFVSSVFYGAVRGDKVFHVISRSGTSCTEQIKAHETQHVRQQWQAWKENVIDAIGSELEAQTFPRGIAYSLTRELEPIAMGGETFTTLKIQFAALFPNNEKKARDAAKSHLIQAYQKKLAAFQQRFDHARQRKAEAFHESQYALDDDCEFVGKGKSAKALGTPGSTDVSPGEPEIDGSDLRPK